MASVTIPSAFPRVNDAAVPWAKEVNKALAELRDANGIVSTNIETIASSAETANSTAAAAEVAIEDVVIPAIQAPTAVPAPPGGLALLSASTGWTETGNPFSEVAVEWDGVTTDVNGNDLPVVGYEVLTATAGGALVANNLVKNPSFEGTVLPGANSALVTKTRVTTWAADGTYSMSVAPTSSSSAAAYTRINAVELGLVAGKTYTFMISAYLPTAQIAPLAADARRVFVTTGAGTVYAPDLLANVDGARADFRITATITAATTAEGITLYNGARLNNGAILYDKFAVIEVPDMEHPYMGDWFSGDTPDGNGKVFLWAGDVNASNSAYYASNPGTLIGTVNHTGTGKVNFVLTNLLPGDHAAVQVRAISVYGVPGILSGILDITVPPAPPVAVEPSAPLLQTKLGVVTATWDGALGTSTPQAGFAYVFAEFARDGTEDWATFGPQLRRRGTVTLTGETIGSTVRIRFRAVDTLGNISDPSDETVVDVVGVEGPDIEANTITGNLIVAGAIEVTHLSPSVGGNLDISANESVTIIAGGLDATNSNLESMQTVYQFTETEAIISAKNSNFTLAMDNDSIEIRDGGVAVSWWNSGQMHVNSFVGETVVLGNHQLEKYGTGTVMRAL